RGVAARARGAAVGRGRFERFLSRGPCRRRRHPEQGLGQHAAGLVYAQDWDNTLLRLFKRRSEQHSYKVEYLEETPGEEAGIKSATVEIKGRNAFGWPKAPAGRARPLRLSPFS